MSWLATINEMWNTIFFDVTKGTRNWYKWSFGILFAGAIFSFGCLFMLVFIPTFYIMWLIEKTVLLIFKSAPVKAVVDLFKKLIFVKAK